jgi:bacterioferritin
MSDPVLDTFWKEMAMETQHIIGALNRTLSLEYAGIIQYSQHSFLVQDLFREVYADYFRDNSRECHGHAQRIGEMISGLGGVPTVEPAPIRQATELTEMIEQDLALEREALQAYLEAIEAAADHVPLRQMLEHMADEEQRAVWHLEKILRQKNFTVTAKEVRLQQVG